MEQNSTTKAADGTALFAGEAWFDPIEAGIRDRGRGFIEELLEQELTAALGRARHERAEGEPAGYRNGARKRQLLGSFGPVARRRLRIPLVAPAAQRRFQLLPDQLFDEPAHPLPDARFNRVKPGVPGKQRRAVCFRLRAILLHGVASAGARTPEMAR